MARRGRARDFPSFYASSSDGEPLYPIYVPAGVDWATPINRRLAQIHLAHAPSHGQAVLRSPAGLLDPPFAAAPVAPPPSPDHHQEPAAAAAAPLPTVFRQGLVVRPLHLASYEPPVTFVQEVRAPAQLPPPLAPPPTTPVPVALVRPQ